MREYYADNLQSELKSYPKTIIFNSFINEESAKGILDKKVTSPLTRFLTLLL